MNKWLDKADKKTILETIDALKKNNFNAIFVETIEEAKNKFFEILPYGASVLSNASVTLDTSGITQEINESKKYDSIKNKLSAMNRDINNREMQQIGSAPEWAVGSVHAVTKDGHVLIASRSGSQIPGYVFGSDHVIWVVGAQKLVKNIDEGIKRIYEHTLPLESKRVQKAYGMEHSDVSKILIFNKEISQKRTTIIIVNQAIGY